MSQNNQLQKCETPGALKAFLEKSRGAIALALPKHLNPDRMLRLTLTAFSTNPDLRDCSAQSILSSIVIASQIGLEPGITGQGYLIPYKGTCTFVPGWQGLVGLLNNTGKATVWTDAVFEGDTFEFEKGSNPRCYHIPGENYGIEDKMTHAYAVGKVNGSEHAVVECWTVARLKRHRDKFNKVGVKHYSFKNFEMYCRKVVLLQVLKYMPRSIELNDALTVTNADDAGRRVHRTEDGVIVDIEPEASDVSAEPAFDTPKTKAPEKSPETNGAAAAPKVAAPAADDTVTSITQEFVAGLPDEGLADALIGACEAASIKPEELHGWAIRAKMIEPSEALDKMTPVKLRRVLSGWNEVSSQIIEARKA